MLIHQQILLTIESDIINQQPTILPLDQQQPHIKIMSHNSVIKLPPSLCLQHNLPFETYCSAQGCQCQIRVCAKCKPSHSNHPEKFFTPPAQVVSDLTTGLKKCFEKIDEYDERTKELTNLIKQAQVQCKEEYQEMQKNLIQLIKQDKKILEKKLLRMQQIHSKLQKPHRLQTYFTRLTQSSLLLLKIKLSNEHGMLQLKQNNEKLCELTSKTSFEEQQKLHSQFYALKQEIDFELTNNFTFRLGQVIAMKNVRKGKGQKLEKKEKENKEPGEAKRKEKNKPKTMTNFGQGIINGILNFLNF